MVSIRGRNLSRVRGFAQKKGQEGEWSLAVTQEWVPPALVAVNETSSESLELFYKIPPSPLPPLPYSPQSIRIKEYRKFVQASCNWNKIEDFSRISCDTSLHKGVLLYGINYTTPERNCREPALDVIHSACKSAICCLEMDERPSSSQIL